MVFQLTDDVLDLVATEDFLGKPAGSDIGEGTYTLPVLLALEGPRSDALRSLLAGGHPYGEATIAAVLDIVRDGDYVQRALAEVDRRIDSAVAAIGGLPSSDITNVFRRLGDYLVERVDAARSAV